MPAGAKLRWIVLLLLGVGLGMISFYTSEPDTGWPVVERQHKPWTFWWWMGSAVDRAGLSSQIAAYAEAGLGGLHVIPIYGVRGQERQFLPYLGPAWMEMLGHAASEAERAGMGLDMTVGTGWPFGGPQVSDRHAAASAVFQSYEVDAGGQVSDLIRHVDEKHGRQAPLQALMAYSQEGEALNLTGRVDDQGRLSWSPERGRWKLIAVFQGWTGQQVKRAAPGGEGNVLDYFSHEALQHYLTRFDSAFAALGRVPVRAFYNDSYEVYAANWTDDFPGHFERRRGYDLRNHLPALLGEGDAEVVARVKSDYRETVGDLLLEEFALPWVAWARGHGALTRNQAHGSPGNLIDLYAAAAIPETEAFGAIPYAIPGLSPDPDYPASSGTPDPLLFRFASSAAHVKGSPLISSETATWLGEHFRVSLAEVKPELDQLFIGGINHVFFHGIPYAPSEESWPGRLFYASTHFGPTNSFWRDLPAFNRYIARCQSFLQSGSPDNDVLLYFPIHDIWHDPEGLMMPLSVHNADTWFYGSSFHALAQQMAAEGYTFDYVSDRLLEEVESEDGKLQAPGGLYQTLLVPQAHLMPVATFEKLTHLAEAGATVVFYGKLPSDAPGLGRLPERRGRFEQLRSGAMAALDSGSGIREAEIGNGRFLAGDNLSDLLARANVRRESMTAAGLQFVRRRFEGGHLYFVTNPGAEPVEAWVRLGVETRAVVLFDPAHERRGLAALRNAGDSAEVYLQLQPGESYILKTFAASAADAPPWEYLHLREPAMLLDGTWRVRFVAGGPELPEDAETEQLVSWTHFGPNAARFSGTARYTISFDMPETGADEWILDLGEVRESARVRVNGDSVGIAWSYPFTLRVGDFLRSGRNELEVEITNLMANRIADMDRRGVEWRKFYDINFVNIQYKPFDASGWEPMPSGLLGPVRLLPADVALKPER